MQISSHGQREGAEGDTNDGEMQRERERETEREKLLRVPDCGDRGGTTCGVGGPALRVAPLKTETAKLRAHTLTGL